MKSKILLLALSAGIFSSCSTSYKSGQTPDDVYYSPVKYVEEKQSDDRDQVKQKEEPQKDYEIVMSIRDRRWKDFNNEYDYTRSPYYVCNCKCNNYGYYYNPSYHPWPVYIAKIVPVNSTPRMVNLNAYRGYNNNAGGIKPGAGVTWVQPTRVYNNSNTDETTTRKTITPSTTNSSSSNSTRTYTPSSSSSSNSTSTPSSNNSGSVSRPPRGG